MPSDSCGWIFFKAMEILARLKSTFFTLILERSSSGNLSKTDSSGNSKSVVFSTCVGLGRDAGAATGLGAAGAADC
jgi:hypothetical protein